MQVFVVILWLPFLLEPPATIFQEELAEYNLVVKWSHPNSWWHVRRGVARIGTRSTAPLTGSAGWSYAGVYNYMINGIIT